MPFEEPKKPRHTLESMAAVTDPIERAEVAQEFMDYAAARLEAARTIRNAAITEARAAGATRTQIATRGHVNPHTVKALTR